MASSSILSATRGRPARGVTVRSVARPPVGAVAVPGPEGREGPGGSVDTINGRRGTITLTSADVGLSNVANVAPAGLPVSDAQALADAAVRTAAATDATNKAGAAQAAAISAASTDASTKAGNAQAAAISAAAADASAKAGAARAAAIDAAASDATAKSNAAQAAAISAAAADATAKANARAASGSNGDITEIKGLTTPLSKGQGGLGNGTGDASGLSVTATGSSVARTNAARAADTYNALEYGLVDDGVTDNRAALAALLAKAAAEGSAGAQRRIVFPKSVGGAGIYGLSLAVALPSFVDLQPLGAVTFKNLRTTGGNIFTGTNVTNIYIGPFTFDGNKQAAGIYGQAIRFTASSAILIDRVTIINPTDAIGLVSCFDVKVRSPKVTGSNLHGVYLSGSYDCEVSNGAFQGNVGFGIILTGGCYRNLIQGNRTTGNGIELVGVTKDSYQNRIIGNHSEGTGDNGISVTGHENLIIGNVVIGCQGNGIELYGDRNTCVSNYAKNNAQGYAGNTGWRAGIMVQGSFGGMGQRNIVSGNVCDDDQTAKTQQYGILIGTSNYAGWASGAAYASGAYVYSGLNLYQAAAAGTAGSTAPTHASGSVSDGGVTWAYVSTFEGSIANDFNTIWPNTVKRSAVAAIADLSGGANNSLVPYALPSSLVVGQISNPGGVAAINLPTNSAYQWTSAALGGALPTVSIGAPASGGQQATAQVTSLFMLGFGTVASTPGAGYAVNDVLTISGGAPVVSATNLAPGSPRTIRVTGVDANGAITSFTAGASGTYYYAAPWLEGATLTGGTGTGAKLSATVWRLGAAPTVTAAGSNYLAAPAVSYVPAGSPSAASTSVLSSSLSISAGAGNVQCDGAGTKLGVQGSGGSPVIALGASVDASGVRVTLTSAGYIVPANTSLVRFTQAGSVTATVTLPSAPADGQVIQFVNQGAGTATIAFSPAVNGWQNGTTTLAAFSGARIRWDATAAAWYREQ
jgi:hypothetical protein